NALYRSGDLRQAADSYGKALALQPSHFEAHMTRGFAFYELKQFPQAEAEWLAAVHLDTKSPFARAGWALGLDALGREDQAVSQYALAVSLDQRYADPKSLSIDIRWKPNALK